MRTLKGCVGGPRARPLGPTVAGLLWLAAVPALATEPSVTTPPTGATNSNVAQEPAASPINGIGSPIATGHLDRLRGGDGSTSNQIDVDGEVSGNSAENIVSGMNLVDGGSFGNAAGISTVIQNSGSNVLIQNAMIVNVQFADPGP